MSLHDVDKEGNRRHLPRPNQGDQQQQRMAHGTTQIHHSHEGTTETGRLQFDERRILATNDVDSLSFGFQDDGTYRILFNDGARDVLSLGTKTDGFAGLAMNDGSVDALKIGENTSNFRGLFLNDGSQDKLFIGKDSGGNYVVKIAQSGVDVKTATNSQLIFNSAQNMFKIVTSGTTTVVTPATMSAKQIVTATITHGLGITPAFLAYVNVPNIGAGYVGANSLQNVPFTLFTYNITPLLYVYGAVDSNTLTLNVANLYDLSLSGAGGTWTFKYYILQETAN